MRARAAGGGGRAGPGRGRGRGEARQAASEWTSEAWPGFATHSS
jgi:hypothetical protein